LKVILTAPTVFEMAPLIELLDEQGVKTSFSTYTYNEIDFEIVVTGVGAVKTAFSMSQLHSMGSIDLAIQVGLAGAYDRDLTLGDVVIIGSDRYGDIGVEESNGDFTSVNELGLEEDNQFPFTQGKLETELKFNPKSIVVVDGITVNTVSGTEHTIARRKAKYSPQVETMEGAAFYYACKILDIQCFQLRAISNYVEPRNRDNWKIAEAISNLKTNFFSILPLINHYRK